MDHEVKGTECAGWALEMRRFSAVTMGLHTKAFLRERSSWWEAGQCPFTPAFFEELKDISGLHACKEEK